MVQLNVVARSGWLPVHPERGPDWQAIIYDEDKPSMRWRLGYEWVRCIVKIVEP